MKDAIQTTKECGKSVAVSQDKTGNVQVASSPYGDSRVYVCWTYVPKKLQKDKVGLVDNVNYKKYAVEQMIPRMRDAPINGIAEYGNLGFLPEGRIQISHATYCCAKKLV